MELHVDESDFECYNRPDGKPVHVDMEKEVTEGGPALKLLPNKSEDEEFKTIGETIGGDGNINVHRSNRIFKPQDQLGSVPSF